MKPLTDSEWPLYSRPELTMKKTRRRERSHRRGDELDGVLLEEQGLYKISNMDK